VKSRKSKSALGHLPRPRSAVLTASKLAPRNSSSLVKTTPRRRYNIDLFAGHCVKCTPVAERATSPRRSPAPRQPRPIFPIAPRRLWHRHPGPRPRRICQGECLLQSGTAYSPPLSNCPPVHDGWTTQLTPRKRLTSSPLGTLIVPTQDAPQPRRGRRRRRQRIPDPRPAPPPGRRRRNLRRQRRRRGARPRRRPKRLRRRGTRGEGAPETSRTAAR
jgi:hypothetical protein